MKFTLSASAFLALVASALAQTADFDSITNPTPNEILTAGQALTIEWDAPAKYAAGTVSIELIGGPTQATQQVLATIATGVKNSAKTFTWNVDSAVAGQNFYGFIFRLESDPSVFQYSNPFHIKAAEVHSSSSSSTPAAPAHTSSSGSYGNLPPADTTTTAPVVTTPVYSPPAVTDVTVVLNATTTVPCRNSTIAPPTLSAPSTLQSATRLPPPPPSSPVYVPPGQPLTSTVWAAPSASNPAITAPAPLPTNAGARVGGSSLALVASLVVAYFAL
ncbi:uncharacterized protein TRIREDRAFT_120821 [Trichoderma reesei QM6a]|uniref:Predicted protein n=1 Tax=Hypocrea jecorina (strain QM6a) TaxID=431241 RepID=G0RDL2_HYPJQ|nr:uncharacterized protein TRIREDRAFT_120821 [Trichoderma reesei QM6a]EGR50971.1 predicted protein [Trichoderma reesei QM6a]